MPAAAPAVRPGDPYPLGAHVREDGVGFAVRSATARAVWLVLMRPADGAVLREIRFPDAFRVGDVFAMTVPGLDQALFHYGYRVAPWPGGDGRSPVILDPYAAELAGAGPWGTRPAYRSAVPDRSFDWGEDRPPRVPPGELVIYELHVRGFTRHPGSGVAEPGTYAGLREKIPYLRRLGVTCVELLPVQEFDETDNTFTSPATGAPLPNYWGYNTVGFFAPKSAYAADTGPGGPGAELKELVKSLHAAGIEIILDVVFNHTAEGDHRGPLLSFRALDEAAHYLLGPDGSYRNLTATGNTVNANHPATRAFILDCLRHWVTEYHVDGFRFDMAAILTRGPDGAPMDDPPLLADIARDPVLAGRRLIAEATDAAGAYQVGTFPHHGRFGEWNMRYRDGIRRFLAGRPGSAVELAARVAGSPDLYPGRPTSVSVNYITCHDGFTLADLTTYERRRNEANGEGGTDGVADEDSWNCGHEGPTDDPEIRALRARQARTAFLLLLTSRGIPMFPAGDEFGRSQGGNNNAYSQDSPTSWLDWSLPHTDRGRDLFRFVRRCLAFRRATPALHRQEHAGVRAAPGADGGAAPLTVLFTDDEPHRPGAVFVAAHNGGGTRTVRAPAAPPGTRWHLFADTAAPPGRDAHRPGEEPACPGPLFTLAAHSAIALVARPHPQPHPHPHPHQEDATP
ncbi:glycogen debranching protein [Streptomyces johnsoniae]|uniref:Alpha-amylase family glycosyl hydrolase n=1 Tax=Streptomyces johnsoniae TaxID=3075532 RepID=A0ABU2SD97_9ACTN|nr:alpha-amylase family glycosyl hydrolase [Streptomyces sp. DSM 41886]MDT0446641.1 alpha-amylase family glycosyl hydrolase [Streptomyces sp. DSM 41886]